MADPKFTRCPGCATVFRVTPEQLALREGQVRCGHCRAVFDANSHLVLVDVRSPEDDDTDELLRGRPTVTLRESHALQIVPARTAAASRTDVTPPSAADAMPGAVADETPAAVGEGTPAIDEAPALAVAETPAAVADEAPALAVAETPTAVRGEAPATAAGAVPSSVDPGELEAARAALRHRSPRPRSGNAFYAFAILLLAAGLGAQTLLEFHDSLAARIPRLTPALASACRWLSCTIRPLRDASALSIEGSDLQADPGHPGLLILTATIRNRSTYALAYPDLELTLTDASDQVVVRRAFAPSEYLGRVRNADAGIAGNREQSVKLFIDATTTNQAGYRLYLFYP
jgi:predicted Zn finger-like uncharacterized protein